MDKTLLTKNLTENMELITSKIPLNNNFKNRKLVLKGDIHVRILYINGLVNQEYIEGNVIKPLLFNVDENLKHVVDKTAYIGERYITSYDVSITQDLNEVSNAIKHGKCVILLDKTDSCIVCNTSGGIYRNITESEIETNLTGGKESFVENLEINVALIQQKFKNNNFKTEHYVLGEETQTDVVLMYVDNVVDKKVLKNIRNKLVSIKTKMALDTGYLTQLMIRRPYCAFPETKTTEKPDKVISDMLQGKCVIIVNGSPKAIVLPVVFIEFFQAIDDYSMRLVLANFERIIRVLGALIILTLSPIYLVLLEYNVELIPLKLIKVISASRLGMPFTPFLEIFFMELLIEFLREGGLRLPTPIGQTLGIVGGIVLGDAAIEGGIVSPTTLVIVAVSVISTFLIPNYEMALALRMLKFPLLILGKIFGFLGIIIGLYIILLQLTTLESFGVPYLSPLAPLRGKGLKDTIIRAPFKGIFKDSNIFKMVKNKEKQDEQ